MNLKTLKRGVVSPLVWAVCTNAHCPHTCMCLVVLHGDGCFDLLAPDPGWLLLGSKWHEQT